MNGGSAEGVKRGGFGRRHNTSFRAFSAKRPLTPSLGRWPRLLHFAPLALTYVCLLLRLLRRIRFWFCGLRLPRLRRLFARVRFKSRRKPGICCACSGIFTWKFSATVTCERFTMSSSTFFCFSCSTAARALSRPLCGGANGLSLADRIANQDVTRIHLFFCLSFLGFGLTLFELDDVIAKLRLHDVAYFPGFKQTQPAQTPAPSRRDQTSRGRRLCLCCQVQWKTPWPASQSLRRLELASTLLRPWAVLLAVSSSGCAAT